jgi:hypothetical protein
MKKKYLNIKSRGGKKRVGKIFKKATPSINTIRHHK